MRSSRSARVRAERQDAPRPRSGHVGLLVTLLLFTGLLAAVRAVGLLERVDTSVTGSLRPGGVLLPVARATSELGSGVVLYAVLVLLAVLQRSWRALAAPLLLSAGQVLEAVALGAVPDTGGWDGWSSGRATAAVLGWGMVVLVLRRPLALALTVGVPLGVVVGSSRVLLGVHAMSDVLLALAVGTALLVAVAAGWERLPNGGPPWQLLVSWLRASPRAWLIPAAAALVAVVPALREVPRFGDLQVYVGSAAAVGAGADVYAFRTEAGLPFTYPPFAALLAEPLARVPLPLVEAAWLLATLAATVGVAAVAMRPVVARIGLPVTVALLLVSTPVRSHVRFGQVGLFLVLLVTVDLLGRRRRSGWGPGLATAIKLTPGIFLAHLLVTGHWALLRRAAAWAAAATVAGLVLLWPSSPTWLTSALWDSSRFGRNDIPGNQSVRGMLLRALSDDQLADRLWLVAALLLLVVALAGARRLERAGNRLGALAVLAAGSVAISPISWQHHLVWLALAIAALVAADRQRLAAAWTAVLIVPVTSIGTAIAQPALSALVVNTCGLTAVAATVALPAVLRGRDGKRRVDPVQGSVVRA